MTQKIEVSHRTIIFTIFFLILLWFVYLIRDIIFLVFVAILLSAILNPTVKKLHKHRIPRALAAIVVYLLGAAFLTFAFGTVLTPLVEQSGNFAKNFPLYLERLQIPDSVVQQVTDEITSQFGTISSQLLRLGVSVFSNILTVFAVLIIALYFLVAREKLDKQLYSILPESQAKKIEKVLGRMEKDLGGWTRGELLLMFSVGFTTYIGLVVLGIPYAVPLGVLAGLLEVVPNIGPVVASVPAVIVGFGISPISGFAVIALSFLIQQVENYVLVPKIMEKSAGINPVVTLLALLVGFRLAGIAGAILAVPVIITLRVIINEYYTSPRLEKSR